MAACSITRRQKASAGSSAAVVSRMENGTPNFAQASEAIGSQEHPTTILKRNSKEAFDALLSMLGCTGHVQAVQIFCGRVEYHRIVDWRRGRCAIPKWAFAYLATLLRQRASVLLDGAALGDNPPYVSPGPAGTIRQWNARRAALKEKPANAAGQGDGDLSED